MQRSEKLDNHVHGLHLEVPGSKIVFLQACFEIYEGIGLVRTLDNKNSRVCVLTTESHLDQCFELLESIREEIPWRLLPPPEGTDPLRYLRQGEQSNA